MHEKFELFDKHMYIFLNVEPNSAYFKPITLRIFQNFKDFGQQIIFWYKKL
jgi:hypothetical protein